MSIKILKEKSQKVNENYEFLKYETPIPLKEWLLSNEYNKMKNVSPRDFVEKEFQRNPLRQIRRNPKYVKCPADGVLIYQGRYKANEKILDIKGKKYTVRDILMDETIPKDQSFYVAGIYLTSYSVHIVRTPTDGLVSEIDYLPPIISRNFPMVMFENQLLKGNFVPKFLEYDFYNERTIITLYSTTLRTNIHIVLIADTDVDKNLPFIQENESILQGQRLAYVLWGSQCDIIIEAKPWFRMKKLIPNFYYTYAGTCNLWEIMFRKNP